MSRYIDADELRNRMESIVSDYTSNGIYPIGFGIEDAIDMVNDMYTADVVEVKRGKWIPIYHNGKFTGGKCSVCGKFKKTYRMEILYKSYKFCHKCGAKMDRKE